MNGKQNTIVICLLATGLLLSSCGQGQFSTPTIVPPVFPPDSSSPMTTPRPTPVPTVTFTASPTSTPTPEPWALYSDEVEIKTLCLEISQSYLGSVDPDFSLPIYKTIEKYLSTVGLQVVDQGGTCAGTLRFSVTAEPLVADYRESPGVLLTCYSGISIQASTTFSVPGKPQRTTSSKFRKDPPNVMENCPEITKAPYEWERLFFRNLGNIWAPEFLYFVIETSTEKEITNYAAHALPFLSPDLLPTVIRDLAHENEAVRHRIAFEILVMLRPDYSGTSDYVEWDFSSTEKSPELIEAARAMQPTLLPLLQDNHWDIRETAALLLGAIGPDAKDAVPSLTNALLLEEERLELEARENCPTPCGSEFHLNDRFFMSAVWAMGSLGTKDAVPALIDLLRRQREPAFLNVKGTNLRPGAIRVTLSAITGQDFGVDPDQWQKWWETQK